MSTTFHAEYPASPGASGTLAAISATRQDDVWALAHLFGKVPLLDASYHWDGKSWTFYPPSGDACLSDILALATDDVWAVGYGSAPFQWPFSQARTTLIRHW